VIELYDVGGTANPYLDPRIKPLGLTEAEIDALVAFLEALEGEGYHDTPPLSFPSADRKGLDGKNVTRAN
jgi:cytochrome c peroxidase